METWVKVMYIVFSILGAVIVGIIGAESRLGGLGSAALGASVGACLSFVITLIASSFSSSSLCTPSDDENTAAGGDGVLSFIKNDSGNCVANSCVEGYTLDSGVCSLAADVDPDETPAAPATGEGVAPATGKGVAAAARAAARNNAGTAVVARSGDLDALARLPQHSPAARAMEIGRSTAVWNDSAAVVARRGDLVARGQLIARATSCKNTTVKKFKLVNGACVFDACQPGYVDIPVASGGKITHMCIPNSPAICKTTTKTYQEGARCVKPDGTINTDETSVEGCCQSDLLSQNLKWRVTA